MESTPAVRLPASARPEPAAPRRPRWARRGYTVLAWAFVAGLAVQVFLAGMAVFAGPTYWPQHRNFAHAIEWLPLLMLVLALLGRLPRRRVWAAAGLVLLIVVQYATANIARDLVLPVVGALHPVGAAALVWLAVESARPGGAVQSTAPRGAAGAETADAEG